MTAHADDGNAPGPAGVSLDALAAVDANRPMLAWLAGRAVPRTPGNASPYDLDDYELHSHPDLIERVEQLTAGLPGGGRCVGVYGLAAAIDDAGVIRVVVLGSAGLAVRLADPAARADAAATCRFAWDVLPDAWVGADAWPERLSLPDGTARLRSWLEAAWAESEGAAAGAG